MTAAVSSSQRYTRNRRCPICDGAEQDPRGKEKRCSGFTGSDGKYAHCSREEHAGSLEQEAGGTYAHKLAGKCNCGVQHGEGTSGFVSRDPEATYIYRNADGAPIFRVVRGGVDERTGKKRFYQQHPDPGALDGWSAGLNGAARTLYMLPELLADDQDRPVYIVEGEKDVETMWQHGHVATCNPEGAGKWYHVADVAKTVLDGRDVIVIADDDPPDPKKKGRRVGHDHARDVHKSLVGIARKIRLVRSTKGKDISDHFAAGGDLDELVALEEEPAADPASQPSLVQRLRDRLVRVEPCWLSEPPPPLEYLVRDGRTGKGALEARGIGLLVAAGSAGKGFTSLSLGLAVSTGAPWLGCMKVERKGRVLFVSAEDSARVHLRWRLHSMAKAMGIRELGDNIDIIDIRDLHVPMLQPDGTPGEGTRALCELVRASGPYALTVIDPISKVAGASIDADNVNANALVGAMEALSMAADGFVLGCHHSALRARLSQDASVNSSRGATGLTDSARAVMTLSVEKLDHGDGDVTSHLGDLVTVHLTKANHVKAWDPIVLRRCDDGALLPLDSADQALVDQARQATAPAGRKKAAKVADHAGQLTAASVALVRALRARGTLGSEEVRGALGSALPGGCGKDLASAAVAHLGPAVVRTKNGRAVEHTLDPSAELPADVREGLS